MNGTLLVDLIQVEYPISPLPWVEGVRGSALMEALRGLPEAFSGLHNEIAKSEYALSRSVPELNGYIVVQPLAVMPSGISIIPGSILVRVRFGLFAAIAVTFNAISDYPDFREGLSDIQQDAVRLSEFLTGRMRGIFDLRFEEPSPKILPYEEVEESLLREVRTGREAQ